MKEKIEKVYEKVGIKSNRTKNISKHVLLSFLYKAGSIISNFLLVPLFINYLGIENYGVWITLSSFVAWFTFFDIGLGNGLRNKFAEANAKNDIKKARGYVSSAYYTIGSISIGLILIFLFINLFIDWSSVFNTNFSLKKSLNILMPIVFGFFCLQLVVKLITTIYIADQRPSMEGKIYFFTQFGSLIIIWIMLHTNDKSLLIFGSIFSILPVLILLLMNVYSFKTRYKDYKPSFHLWKKEFLKDIFGLGFKFFIIQMGVVILFSTDNIIIAQLYGPKEVVPYFIAFKYLSVAEMALILILNPYWSSMTEAYVTGDYNWIKVSMMNLIKISIVAMVMVFIMAMLSDVVYSFWIGFSVKVPFSLTLFMAFFIALKIFYYSFTFFINSTGKINLQMIYVAITALVNVPLSIYLAKEMNMGVNGIILSTIICIIPAVILSPLQYKKIISNNAKGIWDK